jgi:hypothetical protein
MHVHSAHMICYNIIQLIIGFPLGLIEDDFLKFHVHVRVKS